MTADNIEKPYTLVFTPNSRLVSFSSNAMNLISIGQSFESIFDTVKFDKLVNESESDINSILFKPKNDTYNFSSHVMKDPNGKFIALIITLIKSTSFVDSSHHINDKIIRMDRLAKVGQLASSIAHEIRNPLAGISANVQVLSELMGNEKRYSEFFDIILEEINRVEKIIKDLLDYSKHTKPSLIPTQLQNIFNYIKTFLSAQLDKQRIKLKFENCENLPNILADHGQLIQIFLNCMMNASQAMPNGGEILITAQSNEDLKELNVFIKDSGVGIKPEFLDKIFEPFFTTRAKGLGLGLSVTKKIIEDHGGKIEINSAENQGTTVILSFPLEWKLA